MPAASCRQREEAAAAPARVGGSFVPGLASRACTPGVFSVGAVYDSAMGGLTWGSAPNPCTEAAPQADPITCSSRSASLLTMLAPGALITVGGITEAAPPRPRPTWPAPWRSFAPRFRPTRSPPRRAA